jgi:hypothetical protein
MSYALLAHSSVELLGIMRACWNAVRAGETARVVKQAVLAPAIFEAVLCIVALITTTCCHT